MRERILKDIKSGDVSMTPRTYFTLKVVALVAAMLGVLVVTIFIFNILYYSIRVSSHDALLGFGIKGFNTFWYVFPWGWLILDVALVVLLQWLLRHFRAGYKIPVLYLIAVLLGCAAVFGFVLEETSVNDRLIEREELLPAPLAQLYELIREPNEMQNGICRCVILAINGSVLVVQAEGGRGDAITVVLPQSARYATTTGLHVGDTIYLAGEEKDEGEIEAFGIRLEIPKRGTMPSP